MKSPNYGYVYVLWGTIYFYGFLKTVLHDNYVSLIQLYEIIAMVLLGIFSLGCINPS